MGKAGCADLEVTTENMLREKQTQSWAAWLTQAEEVGGLWGPPVSAFLCLCDPHCPAGTQGHRAAQPPAPPRQRPRCEQMWTPREAPEGAIHPTFNSSHPGSSWHKQKPTARATGNHDIWDAKIIGERKATCEVCEWGGRRPKLPAGKVTRIFAGTAGGHWAENWGSPLVPPAASRRWTLNEKLGVDYPC